MLLLASMLKVVVGLNALTFVFSKALLLYKLDTLLLKQKKLPEVLKFQ
jgi:hypothetical protein